MKKLFLFVSITIAFISTMGVKVSAKEIDEEYLEVVNFFNDNIDEMTSSYNEVHNDNWNATIVEDVTKIYDISDNQIGYLVIFDEGYLSYTNELSVLDVATTGYPSYYKTSFGSNDLAKVVYENGYFHGQELISTHDATATDIYYPLDDYYKKDKFTINSSMVQIPYFKDIHDSSSWGNYMGISFSYFGEEASAVFCTLGLMYTLKVNGGVDLTPYQTSYENFRYQMYFYTNFDYEKNGRIIDFQTLSIGVNQYLKDNFGTRYEFNGVGTVNNTVPAVTLYYNNLYEETAEYCMRVGHAQEPSWWIFFDYYDIVMANCNNFFMNEFGEPTHLIPDDIDPYYIVNQNYRRQMFQFFEGSTLLK